MAFQRLTGDKKLDDVLIHIYKAIQTLEDSSVASVTPTTPTTPVNQSLGSTAPTTPSTSISLSPQPSQDVETLKASITALSTVVSSIPVEIEQKILERLRILKTRGVLPTQEYVNTIKINGRVVRLVVYDVSNFTVTNYNVVDNKLLKGETKLAVSSQDMTVQINNLEKSPAQKIKRIGQLRYSLNEIDLSLRTYEIQDGYLVNTNTIFYDTLKELRDAFAKITL